MRIGFDATILGPATRHSGVGRYCLKLLNNLALLDPSHDLVIYGTHGSARPADLHGSVRWRPLPRLPLGKLSAFATFLWSLPRLARDDRLDLLHAPTVHPRPSWPPLPRRLPCPLVVTVHDLIPLTFYGQPPKRMPWRFRTFYRWNLRAATRADRVITVSETSRREILARLGLHPSKVVTIYNGVEIPRELPSGDDRGPAIVPPSSPYVLFVGSYEPRKNLLGFLRAYALAVKGGLPYDLVVTADPKSGTTAEVHSEVSDQGLGERVRFYSRLSDANLWRLYKRAEMFAFPSLAEGFGFPPLEAMAAGVPVLASDLPALREVLGDTAYFVSCQDERAWTAALLHLADRPELRQRLASSGLPQANRYQWRGCAQSTLRVYEEVVDGVPARDKPLAISRIWESLP